MTRTDARPLRDRFSAALAARVTPDRTRRATRFERLTVQRLEWEQVVRLHRYLEVLGKLTTAIWVGFVCSAVLGFDWKQIVEDALNSGEPVKEALILAILLPTLLFLAARSAIGFARWRLQRELWRRDVERLGATRAAPPPSAR